MTALEAREGCEGVIFVNRFQNFCPAIHFQYAYGLRVAWGGGGRAGQETCDTVNRLSINHETDNTDDVPTDIRNYANSLKIFWKQVKLLALK